MTTVTESGVATQIYAVYIKENPEAIRDAITNPERREKYVLSDLKTLLETGTPLGG
jgi:hypothetical protein